MEDVEEVDDEAQALAESSLMLQDGENKVVQEGEGSCRFSLEGRGEELRTGNLAMWVEDEEISACHSFAGRICDEPATLTGSMGAGIMTTERKGSGLR